MDKDKKVKNPVWLVFNIAAVLTLLLAVAQTFGLFSISWWLIFTPFLTVSIFTLFVGAVYTATSAALDKFKNELLVELKEQNIVLLNENTDITIEALARAHEAMKETQ